MNGQTLSLLRLQEGRQPADFTRVSLLTPLRRARVGVVAALAGAVLAGVPAVLPAAHADTSGQLSSQAKSLLAKVHALQVKANAAERRYQRAFSAVADSVNIAISADQASAAVAQRAELAAQELSTRVRGLYESGGSLATYAAVLDTGSVTSIFDRNEIATRVLSAQMADVRSSAQDAAAAQRAASRDERREHLQIGTERNVAAAANKVATLLRQEKALLAKTNKRLAAVHKAEVALAAQTASFGAITTSAIAGLHILPPSADYLALYQSAGTTCPGLPWTVLAAIGQVESGHGRNPSTSSAGAMGPMQFEPPTFQAYAVDGDQDGTASIMDPADAIYTAAHYLCANGAGRSAGALSSAILHYNHAAWYVEMVEKLANMYASAYA
jgi:membrane-bound lytic murein transglycosylase B